MKTHYDRGKVCVLAPDSVFVSEPKGSYDIPVISINDSDASLDQSARIAIVDRVLVELRPHTVHIINSDAAWQAFVQRGKFYSQDIRVFGNIYSDIRVDTLPVGAFWEYLPHTIAHLSGVIADNNVVVKRAEECFGFSLQQMAKFHVLPTPVIEHRSQLREFRQSEKVHSLWMSRIAVDKRLDVLEKIASRIPRREFSIFGAMGALPVDLSWTEKVSNVHLRGGFGSLSSLLVADFDSYVFTTRAEGMPISLLEAAMLGVPIVAPNVGGIPEFIDETTGWLVNSSDAVDEYITALNRIQNDPREAQKRVRASQERLLERHSWSNFSRLLSQIPGYLKQ